MREDRRWLPESRTREHRWPEQPVEVNDVLANKVVKLGITAWLPLAIKVIARAIAEILMTGNVTNGCVEPDIEILLGMTRNLKPEVRRVTRDVPILQTRINPLPELVGNRRLELISVNPRFEQILKLAQLKKQMVRCFLYGCGP